jgi:hypothetical protein
MNGMMAAMRIAMVSRPTPSGFDCFSTVAGRLRLHRAPRMRKMATTHFSPRDS